MPVSVFWDIIPHKNPPPNSIRNCRNLLYNKENKEDVFLQNILTYSEHQLTNL